MRVKIEQFCGLSTNNTWQQWLYKFDITLYNELITHLRASLGCGHNRTKMLEIVDKIKLRPNGWTVFIDFLRTNFPNLLEDTVPPSAGAGTGMPAPDAIDPSRSTVSNVNAGTHVPGLPAARFLEADASIHEGVGGTTTLAVPFEAHSANLLTFPRRIILVEQIAGDLLPRVNSFIKDKVKYDYIIIGNQAFIEYIPGNNANIVDKIPVKSWRIAAFKATR